jgi:beta-lactam-binding protein with PASTA domain
MKKFLWVIPFLSFLGGYLIMSFIYQPRSAKTPTIIGKSVQQALNLAASQGLSLRLLAEREEPDIPAGTILSQNPLPNTHIKAHQSIACVVSKKTEQQVPNLIGKSENDIINELASLKIDYTFHRVASQTPAGICIAQNPRAGSSLNSKKIVLYLSQGSAYHYIFPDFRQKDIDEVKNFLASKPVTIQISHLLEQPEDHTCSQCIVSDQRPRPGTVVQLNEQKPINVQLIATPVIDSRF